jgi:hypothetical protein
VSNNSFSFADELRVNSKLRTRFAQLCSEVLAECPADMYESDIEQYGAEDLVEKLMAESPEQMSTKFGVR